MNRLVRSLVLVVVLALLAACGGTAPSGGGAAASPAASTAAASADAVASARRRLGGGTEWVRRRVAGGQRLTGSLRRSLGSRFRRSLCRSFRCASAAASGAASPAPSAAASGEAGAGGELLVFAAASLTDAFTEIGQQFDAANNATTSFNFAGSNQLAQQIVEGAPADVFASANNAQMNVVIESGDVISGTQQTFARNRLVVIHPSDNPASITTLEDLANPGVKLVLAAKEVPVGQYSLDFLAKASEQPQFTATYSETVLANVVSYEENVRSVLSKVSLGEADAGIVYTSDISGAAADTVGSHRHSRRAQHDRQYPIAVTTTTANPELAQAFMDYVLSPEGQQILVKYGFIPTTGDAGGAAPDAVPVEVTGLVDTPRAFTADDPVRRQLARPHTNHAAGDLHRL